jgi:predicted GIY-YIG superfamily endonuclease
VYLMKDADGQVLYVGKAKNLKQRLDDYRLANPDRMPRRHLQMVRHVAKIEFQFCANENAALKKESQLLRKLRPKFNRAGVWPGKARFVVWRLAGDSVEIKVVEVPEAGWHRYGPLSGGAIWLHQSFCRLFWLLSNPSASAAELPSGWGSGQVPDSARIGCGDGGVEMLAGLEQFFWADGAGFLRWLSGRLAWRTHPFERTLIAVDMELLETFSGRRPPTAPNAQLALL